MEAFLFLIRVVAFVTVVTVADLRLSTWQYWAITLAMLIYGIACQLTAEK